MCKCDFCIMAKFFCTCVEGTMNCDFEITEKDMCLDLTDIQDFLN